MRLHYNGVFKIIERKSNLFKLAQGEYIAPEKLEMAYSRSLCVQQIFVYGISTELSSSSYCY